jgi:chromosome segregation ATPase
VIGAESVLCREALNVCKGLIREAEQAEEEESKAKTAYDKTRDELGKCDKARHTAILGYEAADNERHRLEREYKDLLDDLDRSLAEVERALGQYGCRDISLLNIDEMFAALTERRNVFVQRWQEKEKLEKQLADLCAGKEK